MNITDYISDSSINLDIKGTNKSEILINLVQILGQTTSLNDSDEIIHLLEEREKLSTTGIGFQIAVPHCKSAQVNDLKIIIARSQEGVDFQSLDGQNVNLFFLLVAPVQSSSEHLKALAKIARFAKDASIRNELLSLQTSKEIFNFIQDKEEAFG